MEKRLADYLKADRQWPRHLRIGHAIYQKSIAPNREEKKFWIAVLEANEAFK